MAHNPTALPPEEDIDEYEEEHDYDPGDGVTEEDDLEEEDDEIEEEDDEPEVEVEAFEWEDESYPDPAKEPWDLKRAEKHFYETLLHEILKDSGVDTKNKKAVSDALNNAWKETPHAMRELEEDLKEKAKAATEAYKVKEYDPWHEQYENARLAEEFEEVLEFYPDYPEWRLEIALVGPAFFEKYPHLAKSPAKALPILMQLVKEAGHIEGSKAPAKKQPPKFETGRRQPRQPREPKEEKLFGKTVRHPGEWVAGIR